MKKKELNIVALPYYEVGACLDEFMSEVVGRALTLRPEPTNEVDALAIRAYDWQGRHIGYVANHSKEQAWKLLIGSGRSSLRETAVAANVETVKNVKRRAGQEKNAIFVNNKHTRR